MKFLTTGSWIMVADGAKALLLENRGSVAEPELRLIEKNEIDNPPTHEQGTDAPGRMHVPVGGQASAAEQTDYHALAEVAFARDLARGLSRRLARDTAANRYLVLVAPPAMLGHLRRELDTGSACRVLAELPKSLTGHPVPKIARIVADDLAQVA